MGLFAWWSVWPSNGFMITRAMRTAQPMAAIGVGTKRRRSSSMQRGGLDQTISRGDANQWIYALWWLSHSIIQCEYLRNSNTHNKRKWYQVLQSTKQAGNNDRQTDLTIMSNTFHTGHAPSNPGKYYQNPSHNPTSPNEEKKKNMHWKENHTANPAMSEW